MKSVYQSQGVSATRLLIEKKVLDEPGSGGPVFRPDLLPRYPTFVRVDARRDSVLMWVYTGKEVVE